MSFVKLYEFLYVLLIVVLGNTGDDEVNVETVEKKVCNCML